MISGDKIKASSIISHAAPWLLGAGALILLAAGLLLATGNRCDENTSPPAAAPEQHITVASSQPTAASPQATEVADNQNSYAKKAPDFDIYNINGGRIRLKDYRGKVVMLDFWSVACGPCVESTAHYQGLWEKYRSRGLAVIGINLDSYPELVKRFIDRAHLTYPIGMATNEVMKNYGGMYTIPQSFLLDKNGNIFRHYNGWGALYAYQSERDIRRLLGLGQD